MSLNLNPILAVSSGPTRPAGRDAKGRGHPELHAVVSYRRLPEPRQQARSEDHEEPPGARIQPKLEEAVRAGRPAEEDLLASLHR